MVGAGQVQCMVNKLEQAEQAWDHGLLNEEHMDTPVRLRDRPGHGFRPAILVLNFV
jgi:hypothetical protein